MPEFVKGFLAKDQLLSFEAIERIVQVLAKSGIKKVRLTGGEPFDRCELLQSKREVQFTIAKVSGPTTAATITRRIVFDSYKCKDIFAELLFDFP